MKNCCKILGKIVNLFDGIFLFQDDAQNIFENFSQSLEKVSHPSNIKYYIQWILARFTIKYELIRSVFWSVSTMVLFKINISIYKKIILNISCIKVGVKIHLINFFFFICIINPNTVNSALGRKGKMLKCNHILEDFSCRVIND